MARSLSDSVENGQRLNNTSQILDSFGAEASEILQGCEANGLEEWCFYICKADKHEIIHKFDSAASNCMSGVTGRINSSTEGDLNVRIQGFNGSTSQPSSVGINSDGKQEYFVPNMPANLVLLCAHAYASDGAAILYKDGGVILRLDKDQLRDLLAFIQRYPATKQLRVRNRTYEIDESIINETVAQAALTKPHLSHILSEYDELEQAFTNTASRFFNTKVNVSNTTERILTLLLTGLSFQDLYDHVKNNSLLGMPPDLTLSALNHFEHKYGRTPDIVRMALPYKMSNVPGLMSRGETLTSCGQRVEIDCMESDFNDSKRKDGKQGRVSKLSTYGNAIAAAVCVDAYSGFVHGKLITSLADSFTQFINHFILEYKLQEYPIKLIASDSGVVEQSVFQVMTTETEQKLLVLGIKTERAEPHNHSRGTPRVERAIRQIKELMRMAYNFILRNPNFPVLGFTKEQVLKLWGEIFYWSIHVINLKPCPKLPAKSRYEVFMKVKPNMQNIRLLPIFSIILASRDTPAKDSQTIQLRFSIALYVGPSLKCPGAIRAATIAGKYVKILSTSRYKPATDGGGLNIYHHVENGLKEMLSDAQKSLTSVCTRPEPVTIDPAIAARDLRSLPLTPDLAFRRSARVRAIEERQLESGKMGDSEVQHEEIMMADWSYHVTENFYFSYAEQSFIQFSAQPMSEVAFCSLSFEDGFKAVTENVPKNFSEALKHPLWGGPARKEFNLLLETKAIVEVSPEVAKEAIRDQGADLVILFPVYEQKIREGEQVYKVRLVGDGRTQHHASLTYSATPSREELLIFFHIIATFDWEYAHLDESRAFLSTEYQGENKVFTKFRGDSDRFWEVTGALYGLKTSPKDYQNHVARRLTSVGFTRLTMCSCIYVLQKDAISVYVYVFVDDFIFACNNREVLDHYISLFRSLAVTTEPISNADIILGYEISRDRLERIISLSAKVKIDEICAKFLPHDAPKRVSPMPVAGYVVKEQDLEALPKSESTFLSLKQQKQYMAIVGALVYLTSLRFDIVFPVLYLSWYTKAPRVHHMSIAIYTLSYINSTRDLSLNLGGFLPPHITAYSDASLGTGPNGRSIGATIIKLNPMSGAIIAKARATTATVLSSFEAELDSITSTIKQLLKVDNILKELKVFSLSSIPPIIYTDNKAVITFATTLNVPKNVRHMELRMWYIREHILAGTFNLQYQAGELIISDNITKPKDKQSHVAYVKSVMNNNFLTSQSSLQSPPLLSLSSKSPLLPLPSLSETDTSTDTLGGDQDSKLASILIKGCERV